jgi:hypothetical protein
MQRVDIVLTKENSIYIQELQGEKTIHIRASHAGEYFCCLVVHDGSVTVDVCSDVADVTITLACITYANHNHPATVSIDAQTNYDRVAVDMTLLSLASEGGVLDITGSITMPPGVRQTRGFLLEENILLHPTARIKALPKLDIRSNDVQASHAAKIHAIDDTKLFYMQARGLSRTESKKIYIQWYIQNIFDKIPTIDPVFVQEQRDRIVQDLSL